MEKKRWLSGRKVAGLVFILFMIDVSCFGAWWAITHPPEKVDLPEGVRIGLPIDPTHYSGQHCSMGAKMAAEEINKYGTGGPVEPGEKYVLVQEPKKQRLPVVIVEEDSQEMSPDVGTERTIAATTKLIRTYGVNVLLGGYATEESLLETAMRYNTLYICTSSSEDRITSHILEDPEKYKYVFSMLNNSTQLGFGMAAWLEHLGETYGFTKIAIIAEEYVWCDPIIREVNDWDEAYDKMEIVYQIRFPSTTTTFLPYLSDAQDAEAQILVGIIALDWGITYLKEWSAFEYGLSCGLVLVAERSTCWKETAGAVEYHLEMIGSLPAQNMSDWTGHFYYGFRKEYGVHPMYAAEYAYGAVYTYCRAVERAGTLETEAVMAELRDTDIILPYCRLNFRPQTQCAFDWVGDLAYWPTGFSQWKADEYRPTVWVESQPVWTNITAVVEDLELPPWIPEDWVKPP